MSAKPRPRAAPVASRAWVHARRDAARAAL